MAIDMEQPRRIVIAGGRGQVGRALAKHFSTCGDRVVVLSRASSAAATPWNMMKWDGKTEGSWIGALEGCDVCINLAGRSVNCRYDMKHREEIYHSRVDSTQLLGRVISVMAQPPKVWLNSSTATIYRHSLDRPMDEITGEYGGDENGVPETWNFSIGVAKAWEDAFFEAHTPWTRKVAMRSAMVMGKERGGVFDVLSGLTRSGLGGTIGSGRQYVSWIHERDFVRAVEWILSDNALSGAVNVASPCPLPNEAFMRMLRRAWNMRFGLPAANWMVEIGTFLMRTEPELVLKSRWVVPGRLQQAGFQFLFPEWKDAAEDLVRQIRRQTH